MCVFRVDISYGDRLTAADFRGCMLRALFAKFDVTAADPIRPMG